MVNSCVSLVQNRREASISSKESYASAKVTTFGFSLTELVLDQNLLSVLPTSLWDLKVLQTLKVSSNRLALPLDKIEGMRALILSESEVKPENDQKPNVLTTLNLRSNRLKGIIILGNYGNLTELDVSENSIENLDLSAVEQLQVLQCSRNCITQLTLHGKNLTSIIAGNNKNAKVIEEGWEELGQDQNLWENLISSIPRRPNAVLQVNAALTKN